MWRLGVVILVLAVVQSAPTGDDSVLLQRLRRSPDCPPGPPGPPPPPPPPPPPTFHHHQVPYSETNAQDSGQFQRFTQEQGQSQGQDYQGQNNQWQGRNLQRQNGCDTCKGQNSAISNAESGTGNAVAIAVSKG